MTRIQFNSRANHWMVAMGLALALGGAGNSAWGQAESTPARSKPRAPLSERRGVTPPAESATTEPAPAPKAEPAKGTDPAKPPGESFLGDTSKFTRLGGWGSMGGAMGQYGVARSMLIMMPAVQAELKVTEEQKKKIREVQEDTRKRGEEMGRTMRERQGDPFQGNEDTSILSRVGQFTSMMSQVSDLMRENEDGFAKVLTAAQRKRLGQISLQMEGVSALTRPEIADVLGLYPIEQEDIQRIVAQSRMMQMTSMVGTMMTMRNERGPRRDRGEAGADPKRRNEAKPTDVKKEADPKAANDANAKDESDRPAVDPKVRAEREKAMRERFSSMRSNNDMIQDRAVKEILKYLNKAQRAKFSNMLGPPFDPNQLNNLGRPPQRNETKPDEAKPDEAKPAETKKPDAR